MSPTFRPFVCLSFCCLIAPAPHALELTLDDAPRLVRERSPELRLAAAEREEIQARSAAAGRRAPAEFSAGFQPALASGAEGAVEIGISREIDRPGLRRLEREAEAARLPVLEAELSDRARELTLAVCGAIVRWEVLSRRLRLLEEQRALLDELAGFLQARAAAGELSPLDAGQARLDAALVRAETAKVAAERVACEGELREALAVPAGEALTVRAELADPASRSAAEPSGESPAEQALRAAALAAEAEAEVERGRARPASRLGFTAGLERAEDAPDGTETEGFAGVTFSRPLFDPAAGDAAALEAGRRALRLRGAADGRRQRRASALAAADATLQALAQRFAAAAEPSRLASDQESLARKAVDAGQAEPAALWRARELRLRLETERLDALQAWHLERLRRDHLP